MYSDDQRKPRSIYEWGPETEPQLRQLYHGQGEPPVYIHQSNPVSWLIGLGACIPFLNLSTGNSDVPVDAAIADELTGFNYDVGVLPDTGSNFASPEPGGYTSPRSATKPILIGNPGGAVPLTTKKGGVTAAWGSRKTRG